MRYYETQSYTNDTMVIEVGNRRYSGNERKLKGSWDELEKLIATELKGRQQTIAKCSSCRNLMIVHCPAKNINCCPECGESNWVIL